jgi:CDP-diacylglycerol--glycerol-3-phosphate 3-phosphatidyltransferase
MTFRQQILQPPNLVSALRLLVAPILFALALSKLEAWFLALLAFSALTDMVDGMLARRLKLTTPLGAHLDSLGDYAIYTTMAVCAWILWPEITRRELLYYSMILSSFLLPAIVALLRFGKLTGYHTWAVKAAVVATFIAYIALYADFASWPFVLASVLCVVAGSEEILITLTLREERTDVRSILSALEIRRSQQKARPRSG